MDVTTAGEKDSAVTDHFPLVANAYHWARNVLDMAHYGDGRIP